jgi:prepilin-type N-terminal cleavage/methylation domain-containing protein
MKNIFNRYSANRGFSLIEMAMVLIIFGLLMGGLLMPLSAQRDLRSYSEARDNLEKIRDALYGYAIINGKLPCPTTMADPADNVNYGHGDAACPITAAAGVLPWKDLGVPEIDSWGLQRNLITDPWVGYWIYRVDPNFTSNFSLTTKTEATNPSPGANIDIHKSDGTSLTTPAERAVAVICTTGKDRVPNGENATFENVAPVNPIYEDDVQSPTFDDMCIWITRPSLFNRMVTAGKLPQ